MSSPLARWARWLSWWSWDCRCSCLGGRLLCWKRDAGDGALETEMAAAAEVLRDAGGAEPEVHGVDEVLLPGHRLLLVRKVRPTPTRYPRGVVERRRALLG